MKRILFLFNVLICGTLMAQEGSVGIGTQSPNENAVLHLVAPNNDQGLLIPKLTTVQRTNFSSQLTTTENGMMVYDSDLDQFFFWMTDHWEAVGSSLQAGTGVEITNGVINNTGDEDADPTNELELPATAGSGQVLKYNGTAWVADTDLSDDGDTDSTNELELPGTATTGQVLKFNGTTWVADIDETSDGDVDASNELQDLNLTSNILTITGIGSPTPINLASYQGTNTDEQDLQFTSGLITLTGDPNGTVIDLSNYDNDITDDFSGNWVDLAGVPVDFSDGTDEVDDADNDPTNELEFPTDALFGQIMKVNDAGSWEPADDDVNDADADIMNEIQDLAFNTETNILNITNNAGATNIDLSNFYDNTDILAGLSGLDGEVVKYSVVGGGWIAGTDEVNDADSDPNNEIELPSSAIDGQVLKYNGTSSSWVAGTDLQGSATTPWSETGDAEGNTIVDYSKGAYARSNNFVGGQISVTGLQWDDGVINVEDHKYFKTLLADPTGGKGVSIVAIETGPKALGVPGQQLIIVNVGIDGNITFSNSVSNSNLYLPDAPSIGPGGTIQFMYVDNEKFAGWVVISYIPSVSEPGPK